MSEFAFANTGNNREFGMPPNPCDPDRLVGGSSSGSAASVADGSVVAALGTDTGGSIRGPPHFVAWRVSNPRRGVYPRRELFLFYAFDTIGPIARSIESCAIIDAVLNMRKRSRPGSDSCEIDSPAAGQIVPRPTPPSLHLETKTGHVPAIRN